MKVVVDVVANQWPWEEMHDRRQRWARARARLQRVSTRPPSRVQGSLCTEITSCPTAWYWGLIMMATSALCAQTAEKWQQAFTRLNRNEPGISGLLSFSEVSHLE